MDQSRFITRHVVNLPKSGIRAFTQLQPSIFIHPQ